jgi:putative membrane protein
MKVLLESLLGCLLLGAVTLASGQTANPAGAAADTADIETGHPPPAHANSADQLFIRELALGGQAEVEFGKLAAQKAQNDKIKAFGRRMTDDHSKGNDKLTPLARAIDVPLRKDVDLDHRVMRAELDKSSGAAFDVAYIRGQVREHQKTAHLLEWEIGSGQDARVRAYAAQMLPVVLDHLEHAQALQAELTGSATRL